MYSKEGCRYCDYARSLFYIEDVEFTELKQEVDFERGDFLFLFPSNPTYPKIFVERSDGARFLIGGYTDLIQHFEKPEL